MHWETEKAIWLILLQYSLYRGGLGAEPARSLRCACAPSAFSLSSHVVVPILPSLLLSLFLLCIQCAGVPETVLRMPRLCKAVIYAFKPQSSLSPLLWLVTFTPLSMRAHDKESGKFLALLLSSLSSLPFFWPPATTHTTNKQTKKHICFL